MSEDTQVVEQEAPATEEVSYETMTNEDLEKAVGNEQPESSAPEATDDKPESEQAEAAEPDKSPEELRAELETARKEAEQFKNERDHWQKVRNEQEYNAKVYRQAREELEKRLAANKAKDPTQMFIDNPQDMMDTAAERARIEMQMEQLGHQEQQYQRQAMISQNQMQIDRFAPDLKDNIDGISQMLAEYGDTPETIQAFRQNYAQFPADKIQAVYGLYKERQHRTALEQQLNEYKNRGSQQLQKVEQASRRSPMTNAASGASKGSDGPDFESMNESDIAALSNDDLNAILGIK